MSMPINGAPNLNRIGDKIVAVAQEFRIQLSATDPQNDPLNFSLNSILPAGANFDKTNALFTWTPISSQVGMRFALTFEVSDGTLKDQETISVQIVESGMVMNLPPQVDFISDQFLNIDQPWQYQVQASDPNNDMLAYTIMGRLPPGFYFDYIFGRAT